MSTRYPGGIITKTPVVPTGPYEDDTAPGIWTLDQQLQYQKAGIWPNPGLQPNFIEEVFSTYLYTGTGASLPIVNGIDLAGEGGLVWTKARNSTAFHKWYDSARGIEFAIESNTTDANQSELTGITSFNSNGYTYGTDGNTNNPGTTYASWTFREQPKFFDIVTYTGTGSNATISHNLGSEPGCIIVKRTDAVASWYVYHRGLSGIGNKYIILNSTAAEDTGFFWTPTDTTFNVSSTLGLTANGGTYVAYLFAHNAGGFGLTGTDNVISCGSFTTDGSGNATVSLGYEPQWILTKRTDAAQSWEVCDNMRAMSVTDRAVLYPNNSDAEYVTTSSLNAPTATGFNISGYGASRSFIYIAIRRGPMKVPTSGTSVFAPVLRTGTNAAATVTTGNLPDWVLIKGRTSGTDGNNYSRLTGQNRQLYTNLTLQEINQGSGYGVTAFLNTAFTLGQNANGENANGASLVNYAFSRAPGFFDEVCWTGDGTNPRSLSHNLTVAPTLIITKKRNSTSNWITGYDFTSTTYKYFYLNDTGAANPDTYASTPVYGGNPTASVFIVGNQGSINQSGDTYVSYLFATVAGVSKVGTYTGTGTTQVINCGFTSGARFVLIKRTDSTGDWYVWDSARGIVAGNDPYLLLNSSAAEVTGTDYVDTASSGFEISSTAPAAINANGGSFIFLAVS